IRSLRKSFQEVLMRFPKLLLVSVLTACAAQAQVAVGAITGTVRDSSGAVIPGAQVKVISESTNIDQTVTAQHNGVYLAPQLPPGEYRISIVASGFKRLEIAGLKVDVGTTLTQDAALEVGGVTESVSVAA